MRGSSASLFSRQKHTVDALAVFQDVLALLVLVDRSSNAISEQPEHEPPGNTPSRGPVPLVGSREAVDRLPDI
jgi:hypothetical protein